MAGGNSSRRGLKICCSITAILLIVVIVVSLTLSLTIFKPKQPQVTANPISIRNIELSLFPVLSLNVTLDMVVNIENPNYGGFKFKNSTAYVYYHGTLVAEVPIEHEMVPAHGKINITTSTEIFGDKLVLSPYFIEDVGTGCLNFTSTAKLHGKVIVFKILKLHATAFSTCDISVFILSQEVKSICKSKIKL